MRFFVYGTLKPGHERFPVIEPFVTRIERAHTPGHLFNLGPYPAAQFNDRIENMIPGYLLWTVDEDHVLKSLDAIEGHPVLFMRKPIMCYGVEAPTDKCQAWSYEYVNSHFLTVAPIIGSWHPERDNIVGGYTKDDD